MPITPLPDPPNKGTDTKTQFDAKADDWVAALEDFTTEANALETNVNAREASAVAAAGSASDSADAAAASAVTALNAPGTSAESSTSLAVGTGTKNLTIQAGKDIVPGMKMVIARTVAPTTYMYGTVIAYDDQTGALEVDSEYSAGSGTYTYWTVSLSGPGMGLSHPPVAAASNSDNSGATVIQDLFFDAYGHCTGRGTKTLSYSDVGAAASSHSHSYLPLAGGTMSGNISIGTSYELRHGTSGAFGFAASAKPNIAISTGNYFLLTDAMYYADFANLGVNGKGILVRQGGESKGVFAADQYGQAVVHSYGVTGGFGRVRLGTPSNTVDLVYVFEDPYVRNAFRPGQNNFIHLGGPSNKWHTVYAVNGSINTSDETEKNIAAIGDCSWLYDLEPISFRWKNDSDRCHFGFSAQKVFEVVPKKDTFLVHPPVPAYGEDGKPATDEDGRPQMSKWGMTQTELIAPMLRLIQEQKRAIDELTERVALLENMTGGRQ